MTKTGRTVRDGIHEPNRQSPILGQAVGLILSRDVDGQPDNFLNRMIAAIEISPYNGLFKPDS